MTGNATVIRTEIFRPAPEVEAGDAALKAGGFRR